MVVPEQAFLFTIDIDILYTNINTQMGLAAVKKTTKKTHLSEIPGR